MLVYRRVTSKITARCHKIPCPKIRNQKFTLWVDITRKSPKIWWKKCRKTPPESHMKPYGNIEQQQKHQKKLGAWPQNFNSIINTIPPKKRNTSKIPTCKKKEINRNLKPTNYHPFQDQPSPSPSPSQTRAFRTNQGTKMWSSLGFFRFVRPKMLRI